MPILVHALTKPTGAFFSITTAFLWYLTIPNANAQVNTENAQNNPYRPGFSGSIDGSFARLGGNIEMMDIGGSLRLQYQTLYPQTPAPKGQEQDPPYLHDRTMIVGNLRFTERSGQAFVNQGLLHGRWTHFWIPRVGSNIFVQHQFNEFQRLRVRSVWGLTLALELMHTRLFTATAGSGYMLEYNRIRVLPGASDPPSTLEHRWSNFVGLRFAPFQGKLLMQSTTYLQPRFDILSDLRFLEEIEAMAKISGMISMGATFSLLLDTEPPSGVKTTDTRLTTMVRLGF